ncbi:unnamed protein product [Clavelina lepadiformis]|uniref:Uncharacterized protein n=1 Tax=Clavelina lepadiformis TaxID=159417 RepID=A0ABP0GL38_CLALP
MSNRRRNFNRRRIINGNINRQGQNDEKPSFPPLTASLTSTSLSLPESTALVPTASLAVTTGHTLLPSDFNSHSSSHPHPPITPLSNPTISPTILGASLGALLLFAITVVAIVMIRCSRSKRSSKVTQEPTIAIFSSRDMQTTTSGHSLPLAEFYIRESATINNLSVQPEHQNHLNHLNVTQNASIYVGKHSVCKFPISLRQTKRNLQINKEISKSPIFNRYKEVNDFASNPNFNERRYVNINEALFIAPVSPQSEEDDYIFPDYYPAQNVPRRELYQNFPSILKDDENVYLQPQSASDRDNNYISFID